jgi:hypothetical protein
MHKYTAQHRTPLYKVSSRATININDFTKSVFELVFTRD